MKEGFIKLSRKMLEWEWYDDINTKTLFIHCLFRANYKDTEWHGIKIKRGSFISSYANLAEETHLSVKQIRTALDHLKGTGEMAVQTTNRYSVFTVNNYCIYQDKGKPEGTQEANKGQTKGRQRATDKEREEREERKKEKKREGRTLLLDTFGEFNNVLLTQDEVTKLEKLHPDFGKWITKLDEYIESTGKNYNNHYLKLRQWIREDMKKETQEINDLPGWYDKVPTEKPTPESLAKALELQNRIREESNLKEED